MGKRLSVLIPSREEQFLLNTVQDILKNRRLDTEIIVVLDGKWPIQPIPDHPDVHLVYHPVSIGQRAATNEAARISQAEFVMKLDAHCALDEGFDAKLLAPYDSGELDRTVTSIPAQHRLHVYNRVCKACGHVEGQGPMNVLCINCAASNTYEMQMVWKPRRTPSTSWVLNADLHFCYDKRDRCRLNRGIHDVMTSLGACWVMKRDRWQELGGLDERIGSWGAVGQEVAGKSWLSGGRHVVNTSTWFAHYFRVGGIGFPYPISGSDQQRARKRSSNIWFNNSWPGQKLPLSWLVEKFWPIRASEKPQWSDESRAKVLAAGRVFLDSKKNLVSVGEIVLPLVSENVLTPLGIAPLDALVGLPSIANEAEPILAVASGDQFVTEATMCSPSILGAYSDTAKVVGGLGNKPEMCRETAGRIITDGVIDNWRVAVTPLGERLYQPGKQQPVGSNPVCAGDALDGNLAVSAIVSGAHPQPASCCGIDPDLGEDARERLAVEVGDGKILVSHVPSSSDEAWSGAASVQPLTAPNILPSLGIVYYTHQKLDPQIFHACRRQLERACNGHHLVSVSWEPLAFGENIVYKPGPSPHTNYFSQILMGLEALDTEYAALCEHDVLYDPSHLTFRPPTDDAYWYNENCWRVDAATGRAVSHKMRSVSGLIAYRELLVEHYRKMLARVKAKGYWYRMGHEPGVFPGRAPGVDSFPAEGWRSWRPNIDVRHKDTLTGSRWSPDKFRERPVGWQEADGVPGWGITKGRFAEWLQEVTR